MNGRPVFVDLGIAVLIAIVVILISPGVAIVALIAILALLAWAADAVIRRWRWKRRPPRRGEPPAPRRRQPGSRREPPAGRREPPSSRRR